MEQRDVSCGSVCDRVKDNVEADINNSTRNEEPYLLNLPLDVLRMIMELCVGVEYLNFRASCKLCRLAAPIIRWSNEASLRRLQTYSLNSPWLVVLDKDKGIITFTDPMFGDKYFIKTPQRLIGDLRVYCSRFGWLLLYNLNGPGELFFFNPFTKDIRELPNAPCLDSLYFLAPPTSPDCLVVGLSASLPMNVFLYCLTWEPSSWARYRMDFRGTSPHSFSFLTIYEQYIFALNQGELNVILRIRESITFSNAVAVQSPRGSSAQYFLASCDQHLVLVVMDELGEFVHEVLKLEESSLEWEKVDSLGSHMVYICGGMCLCMEARTRGMENKIYLPRLDDDGKTVFYSLETRRYHTFDGRNIQQCSEDMFGAKPLVHPHAWIEPSWS